MIKYMEYQMKNQLKKLQEELIEKMSNMPYGDIGMGYITLKLYGMPNLPAKIKYLKEVLKGQEEANEVGKATERLVKQLPNRVPDKLDAKLEEKILDGLKSGDTKGSFFIPSDEISDE